MLRAAVQSTLTTILVGALVGMVLGRSCGEAHAYDRECAWAPPAAMHCCKAHALAYVQGGSEAQRYQADMNLHSCMVVAGVDRSFADAMLNHHRKYAGRRCSIFGFGCWRYARYGGWGY